MDLKSISAIEKIKIGDIKSAMDQLHFLCSQVSNIKENITAIYEALSEKVDLTSAMQDGSTVVTKVGSGIISSVSTDGVTVTGTGTLFTAETQTGDGIRIGSETTYITAVTSDTVITVSPALTGSYSNVIYAIVKNATKEVLTGDFNFGILNGNIFNGSVIQGSTFQHYGRMSQPNDIVNISFVQKSVNPVMVRAQNAIQRNGDSVAGTPGSEYSYTFNYLTWAFGANTDVRYDGIVSNGDNIVNVNYITNAIAIATDKFYARLTNSTIYLDGSISKSANSGEYITVTSNGFVAVKSFLGIAFGSVGINLSKHYSGLLTIKVSIQINSIYIQSTQISIDTDNTNMTLEPRIQVSSPIYVNAGDIISVKLDTTNTNQYNAPVYDGFDLAVVSL
jgi:hypothetical protein